MYNNFYVDDGLKSVAKPAEAIDLLTCTRAMLARANLCLHKIASSHPEVTHAFPREDQASDLRDLDFSLDTVPIQRALGVLWEISADAFTFKVSLEKRPFTRRDVLSVFNSLYDPLGLAAPVIVRGKLLLPPPSIHDGQSQQPSSRKLGRTVAGRAKAGLGSMVQGFASSNASEGPSLLHSSFIYRS